MAKTIKFGELKPWFVCENYKPVPKLSTATVSPDIYTCENFEIAKEKSPDTEIEENSLACLYCCNQVESDLAKLVERKTSIKE
ncbi:MAG: hypothetical protein ISS23_01485 [Nanoarchaeota archaeon]|nr:hypothetical protein [Nanoarchaeota archaeon]